jgi:hypothetical protein
MTDNIYRLPGAECVDARQQAAPSQDVIALLEEFLNRAKAGQVASIACVALTPHGASMMAWSVDAGEDHAMIGAVAVAQAQMVQDFVRNPEFEEWRPHDDE